MQCSTGDPLGRPCHTQALQPPVSFVSCSRQDQEACGRLGHAWSHVRGRVLSVRREISYPTPAGHHRCLKLVYPLTRRTTSTTTGSFAVVPHSPRALHGVGACLFASTNVAARLTRRPETSPSPYRSTVESIHSHTKTNTATLLQNRGRSLLLLLKNAAHCHRYGGCPVRIGGCLYHEGRHPFISYPAASSSNHLP